MPDHRCFLYAKLQFTQKVLKLTGILTHTDKVQWQDQGHNSES